MDWRERGEEGEAQGDTMSGCEIDKGRAHEKFEFSLEGGRGRGRGVALNPYIHNNFFQNLPAALTYSFTV